MELVDGHRHAVDGALAVLRHIAHREHRLVDGVERVPQLAVAAVEATPLGEQGEQPGYAAHWLSRAASVVQPRHAPTSASVSSSLSLHAGAGPLPRLYTGGSSRHSSSTTTYIHRQKSSKSAISVRSPSDTVLLNSIPVVAGRVPVKQAN